MSTLEEIQKKLHASGIASVMLEMELKNAERKSDEFLAKAIDSRRRKNVEKSNDFCLDHNAPVWPD